jgi:hypothetical protein
MVLQTDKHRTLPVAVSVYLAFASSFFDVTRKGGPQCVQEGLFTFLLPESGEAQWV